MKKYLSFRVILQKMITTNLGTISSKVIVGATSYLLLTVSLIVLMFVNPDFPGLPEIITVLLITSASLLGLTTIENIKNPMEKLKTKLCTEGAIDTSLEEKQEDESQPYNPLRP